MSHPRIASVRLRLTRLGWHVLLVGVFATLGGSVRSFNLPLVLAGLIFAALITQWRWSRRVMEAIEVARRLPLEAFAGQPFAVRFLVHNRNRWLSVWALRIEDHLTSVSGHFDPVSGNCAIGRLHESSVVEAEYECVIPRRGRYELGPAIVSTLSPFGLMEASFRLPDRGTIHVFPKLLPMHPAWRGAIQSRAGGQATTARRSGMEDGDFFGLRSWQAGDSRRHIHWRTTARLDEPAVRQFEQQRRFDLFLLVEIRALGVDAGNPYGDPSEDASNERVISAAASLICKVMTMPGNRIGLAIAGEQTTAIAAGGSREQWVAMLRLLSEAKPAAQPAVRPAVDAMLRTIGRPKDLLFLSVRPMPPEYRGMIETLATRSQVRWLSVEDGSIHQLVGQSAVDSKPSIPAVLGGPRPLSPSSQAIVKAAGD